jgi:hypothetical protein
MMTPGRALAEFKDAWVASEVESLSDEQAAQAQVALDWAASELHLYFTSAQWDKIQNAIGLARYDAQTFSECVTWVDLCKIAGVQP